MMPSWTGGGGGAARFVVRAAVHEDERDDVLFDAVFEDRELVLRQVGHELPLLVADDDVGGDDVDAAAEDVPLLSGGCGRCRGRGRCGRCGGGSWASMPTPNAEAMVITASAFSPCRATA